MAGDRASLIERLLLTQEIEEFLYHEAELLDERRYEEWLDLLAEDLRYWMPIRRNVEFNRQEREETRELEDMSWFNEGKVTLSQRVQQLNTGVHGAEEPLSRVCHVVSNVQILEETSSEVKVKSRFVVYRNRAETETDSLWVRGKICCGEETVNGKSPDARLSWIRMFCWQRTSRSFSSSLPQPGVESLRRTSIRNCLP